MTGLKPTQATTNAQINSLFEVALTMDAEPSPLTGKNLFAQDIGVPAMVRQLTQNL